MEQTSDGQTAFAEIMGATPAAPLAPDPGQVAPPAVQPQVEATPPPAVDPAAALAPAPQAPELRPTPTVPLPELMEERRARQEAQRQAAFVQGQLQQLLEAQRAAQQPAQQPIDPNLDPGAAYAALQQQIIADRQQRAEEAIHHRANTSEMLARQKHGDQAVDQAVDAALKSGLNRHFMAQPDPYRALIDWNNSQRIAQEIGNDPNAYRTRVEAEVRAKILAEMRAGTPPPRNLPPSLATATQAASAPQVHQEAGDFFKQMMNRKG